MTAEVIDHGEWTRPLPDPEGESKEFFEACARGELLIQECPSCGHRQHYPRAWCTECGQEPVWLTTAGTGTVNTYTVVRQHGQEPFRSELPYVVAMVELDEGPLVMGNITGCAPEDVHIGVRVEVYMVRATDDVAVPFWRPVASDGD